MILLVTNKHDFAADRVVHELTGRGAAFGRLNTEDFPATIACRYRLAAGQHTAVLDLGHGREVDLAGVTAVWYRRPEPATIDARVSAPAARRFARRESVAALRAVLALAGAARWVNRPEANRAAEHKLVQLAVAAGAGLRTPETVVTNDPREAARFHAGHRGGVVVKSLGPPYLDHAERTQVYTSRVRPEHLDFLADVAYAPVLLQERIDKRLEIRVTVVGQRVLAASIDSQTSPVTRDDWRRDVFLARHAVHALPDDVVERCLRVVRHFGLVFAAVDLILTPGGEYVFLELNPNGEWDWIEAMTGLPLAAALTDVLTGVLTEGGAGGAEASGADVPGRPRAGAGAGTCRAAVCQFPGQPRFGV
ncbi:MAG TPA: hypothetical protein VHA75_10480 [Rugosimonospora sp.]|nr:hypothetical protein [Rugosimonospora sp.]